MRFPRRLIPLLLATNFCLDIVETEIIPSVARDLVVQSAFAAESDSDSLYGPWHVHGHAVIHSRSFPGLSSQSLISFGGTVHWELFSILSLGPYFRGLSSFISGTDTTQVLTSFHDVGLTVNFFPPFGYFVGRTVDLRFVITAGALLNIHKITFSHKLIATEELSVVGSSYVFPIEVALEFILSEFVSFKYFVGYTLFEQAQGIYHGPAVGMIF